VNPPTDGWSLTLPPGMWAEMSAHLFRDDGDEHGAVLLAGYADGPRGPRLLGRTLIHAVDGVDYVPGQFGHRALTSNFVRDAALRAHDEALAYLAVPNHFGLNTVAFSPVDMASHERGYPALRQITGQIVGAVVLTPHAAAGDLWLPNRTRHTLAEVVIPAGNLLRLRPTPATAAAADPRHDRQARLFGDLGQHTLHRLRIAVVGLGGVAFHTNDDDKDHDSQLKVQLESKDGLLLSSWAQHGDLTFADHGTVGPLFLSPGTVDRAKLVGAILNICIAPAGNDTWRFDFLLKGALPA